jgi:hypothetical protein
LVENNKILLIPETIRGISTSAELKKERSKKKNRVELNQNNLNRTFLIPDTIRGVSTSAESKKDKNKPTKENTFEYLTILANMYLAILFLEGIQEEDLKKKIY